MDTGQKTAAKSAREKPVIPVGQSVGKQKQPVRVFITGIDIPTGDLVVLMVKIAFASIPAAIIVGVLWSLIVMVLGGIT